MLWKNFEKMAKFYSDKEWLSHSQESRNPWSTSATYLDVGSLGKAILLAEQTGHLPKERGENSRDEIRERAKRRSSSIKLIEQLENLSNLRKSLNKVKVMIHHYQLEQDTKDLTNPSVLEEKIKKMEELSMHFSAIVDKKEELIHRLQQPFVGDYICIDAEYHRDVIHATPCLANVLSNLTTYLETLTWSTQFSLDDGEMEKILGNVSSVLAQMQSFYQSLCLSRNLMSKLLEEDKKSAGTI